MSRRKEIPITSRNSLAYNSRSQKTSSVEEYTVMPTYALSASRRFVIGENIGKYAYGKSMDRVFGKLNDAIFGMNRSDRNRRQQEYRPRRDPFIMLNYLRPYIIAEQSKSFDAETRRELMEEVAKLLSSKLAASLAEQDDPTRIPIQLGDLALAEAHFTPFRPRDLKPRNAIGALPYGWNGVGKTYGQERSAATLQIANEAQIIGETLASYGILHAVAEPAVVLAQKNGLAKQEDVLFVRKKLEGTGCGHENMPIISGYVTGLQVDLIEIIGKGHSAIQTYIPENEFMSVMDTQASFSAVFA